MKRLLIIAALAATLVIPGTASAWSRGTTNAVPTASPPTCYVVIRYHAYPVSCWQRPPSFFR